MTAMLREGPMTSHQIADRLQEAHGVTRRRARETVDNILGKMWRAGWARLEDGLWGLVTA